MKIEKNNKNQTNVAIYAILILYITLSSGFIFFTLYNNFKINIIQKAYTKGQQDAEVATVQKIIQQAENTDCKPFQVFINEKKVNLMNIACLQAETKTPKTETSENSTDTTK
ncbi:hypothetical protein HYV57_03420 [Candidatus Peregrinibacteria bacterium]|nr:hypothetical protein [Candidatus Peregrinibacteria bacterium]